LDVIAPPAFTDRTARLERIDDAKVTRGDRTKGGVMVSLVANPAALPLPQRQALFSLTDRKRFVDVILHDEAVLDGPSGSTASPTPTSAVPSLSAPVESSPVSLFVHAMQRKGRKVGVTFDLRQGEFDQILTAFANSDFDVVMNMQPSTLDRCWICEAATVNAQLASDADARKGDAAARLERQLATEALVLPLWREIPVIAVTNKLKGVTPNGFSGAGPAWNLGEWEWDRA
ncbi:MAG: hypothetical protein Q8K63_08795, partial [Acidimicrobiales bacterium]|nr:hypothetical protein [Acidimicrobiales bacterium]